MKKLLLVMLVSVSLFGRTLCDIYSEKFFGLMNRMEVAATAGDYDEVIKSFDRLKDINYDVQEHCDRDTQIKFNGIYKGLSDILGVKK